MDVDLEPMIHRLVEREKEYIREDREEYGCAMAVVVSSEGIHLDYPKFDDEDSKRAAYERLVRFAREKNATAIVTLNNAWTKAASYPGELDDVQAGGLNSSNASPCLLVTISGPGIKSRVLEMAYELSDTEVRFGSLQPLESAEVNLLPGWSETAPNIMPST
jgi:hypothetical protein